MQKKNTWKKAVVIELCEILQLFGNIRITQRLWNKHDWHVVSTFVVNVLSLDFHSTLVSQWGLAGKLSWKAEAGLELWIVLHM